MAWRKRESRWRREKRSGKTAAERTETVCFMNMCMIEDEEGRVLALDKVDDSYSGTTFPGGHVEPGEVFSEAMIREVIEETGLTIRSPRLRGVYHWYRAGVHNVVFLYEAREFTGILKSSSEGRVYWTTLEEFRKKELAGGMEQVLEMLRGEALRECYMRREGDRYVETLY